MNTKASATPCGRVENIVQNDVPLRVHAALNAKPAPSSLAQIDPLIAADDATPTIREHVLAVTTAFSVLKHPAASTASPKFSDDEHAFWARDSWQCCGY